MKGHQDTQGSLPAEKFSGSTLSELLRFRAEKSPGAIAYRFLVDGEQNVKEITYAALHQRAQTIANTLIQNLKLSVGDRAVLIHSPGLSFIESLFGCFYAGVIAVPSYTPINPKTREKLNHVLAESEPKVILKDRTVREGDLASLVPLVPSVDMDEHPVGSQELFADARVGADKNAIAFIQYTSGSTSHPKGVALTHGNLLHNLELEYQSCGFREAQAIGGWLPPYHDMGLIGMILGAIYTGVPCVFMSPFHFIEKPARWLKMISDYRITASAAPNFAFDYCVQKVTDKEKAGLALDCWKIAGNGSEPVHWATLERFSASFSPYGFKKEFFFPCYGLAEATLFVSVKRPTSSLRFIDLVLSELQKNIVKKVLNPEELPGVQVRRITSVGVPCQEVCIVDANTREKTPPNQIGEIWVRGESISPGYSSRAINQESSPFHSTIASLGQKSDYLRSGDLGFLEDGELYVVGRLKDVVIIRGLKYHPEDIESCVERSCSGVIRSGGVAAFSNLMDSVSSGGTEGLAVLCEVQPNAKPDELSSLAETIFKSVSTQFNIPVRHVGFLPLRSLPRTTSGKLQRGMAQKILLGREPALLYVWEDRKSSEQELSELVQWMMKWISKKMNKSLAEYGPDTVIVETGMDSVEIVEMGRAIEDHVNCRIDPRALFEFPTIEKLAAHFLSQPKEP